jgi:GTP-binding protein EngB required for normal cell division
VKKHRSNLQYFKRKKLQRKFFNQLNIKTKIILEKKNKIKKKEKKKVQKRKKEIYLNYYCNPY